MKLWNYEIIAYKFKLFQNPKIYFIIKRSEVNNSTYAIVSAPWQDKITLHATKWNPTLNICPAVTLTRQAAQKVPRRIFSGVNMRGMQTRNATLWRTATIRRAGPQVLKPRQTGARSVTQPPAQRWWSNFNFITKLSSKRNNFKVFILNWYWLGQLQ